jgi:uncharacterized protein DUF6504
MKRGRKKLRRHEPINLTARRYNYFPHRFMWRGKDYHVTAVQEVWTKMQHRGTRQSARHYFRVKCREGTFDIFQDMTLNAWYLAAQVN